MRKIKDYNNYFICLLGACCFFLSSNGQTTVTLRIQPVDRNADFVKSLGLTAGFESKNDCINYISQLPSLLKARGYITASVDSVKEDSSGIQIQLFTGDQYTWHSLAFKEENVPLLRSVGIRPENFNRQPFNTTKVSVLYDQLLDYFENNGYPFATVGLDSIQLQNGRVSAKLNISKGDQYHIDSIALSGNAKIETSFLYHYLGIEKGSLYNQAQLNKIPSRLGELVFVQETQPWNITMLNTGAILNLYLDQKRSNEINALVGFLPANQQLGGKLLFTGEATLNLRNAFGKAETIAFNWQQIQPKSPRLNIGFQYPYLFGSLLGLDFNFELFKKDSSFLNVNGLVGINYFLSARQSGKVFIQTGSTSVLNVDTNLVKLTRQLPQVNDVSSVNLGVEYRLDNTDYRYNPRSGNLFLITVLAGKKNVKKSNSIVQLKEAGFNYESLYDTVQLKAYQIKMKLDGAHYFKTGRQSTFKTGIQAGWYQSSNYFLNDLFQIGGYKLLRGFDEESIYTNLFAVATLEYRYLLAQNSYFFGFTDLGSAAFKTNSSSYSHQYIGAGAGLAFETGTGIFNISYAVGKRDDSKFDFRQSKIHLGFVSRF